MSQNNDRADNSVKVSNIYWQKDSGIASGTFLNGEWVTRPLNKIVGDAPVELNVNKSVFTLKPGKYMITCSLPAYNVGIHQARLFNVTANKTAKYGNSSVTAGDSSIAAGSSQSLSLITYYTGNLTNKTKFRVEHRCESMQLINGFGVSSDFPSDEAVGQVEISGEVQIIKLS